VTEFCSGPAPKGFKPGYESFLFNTEAHRLLQSKTGWTEFHLLDSGKKKILSSIFFNIKGGIAVSPLRAPFGSFEMSEQVQAKEFYDFVFWIEGQLRKTKVIQVEILCPPELYMPTQPLITSTLVSQGYAVIQAEPGCCISVNAIPLTRKMRPNKKRVLWQGQKAGLVYKKLPLINLKEIYFFLEACRKEKGQTLSMTLTGLGKTIEAIPKSFFLVGVYLQDQLIAASVCIRVSQSIVYTFYLGHFHQYDKISPVVFLINSLYDWCSRHGIALLDLGTSTLDGKPNFSLLDFKLRMGGTLTPKYRFQKTLNP